MAHYSRCVNPKKMLQFRGRVSNRHQDKGGQNMVRDWRNWFEVAGIRALKTAAQAALGIISSSVLISEVDFKVVLSASAIAAISSLLMSINGIPEEEQVITTEDERQAYITLLKEELAAIEEVGSLDDGD